jgi:hypothetical protein
MWTNGNKSNISYSLAIGNFVARPVSPRVCKLGSIGLRRFRPHKRSLLPYLKPGLWIRIRIGSGFSDFVNPDPYWESGSKGKKIKKFQWKNALFSYFFILPLKRYKIALTTFEKKSDEKHRYFLFDLTQILISTKFKKLSSNVLF